MTIQEIKQDENFLCGLELDKIILYLIYQGSSKLKYYAFDENKELLFEGNDYKPAPSNNIDSLESVIECLAFLTVQPGDTDAEYFANYTEKQAAWAKSHDCEYLSGMICDFEDKDSEYYQGAFEYFNNAFTDPYKIATIKI